jgi:ribosomal protein S18 acetylase RimI-like enzyme
VTTPPSASSTALQAGDHERLATFCQRCTDFFQLVEGRPGGAEPASTILGPLPAHVASGKKHVFGFDRAGDMVAIAEILEGFPGANDWYVGLLLVAPDARGRGLGAELWGQLRDWIERQQGRVVRLIVQKQNPGAYAFWSRAGFTVERETVTKVGELESPVWVMTLAL